MGNVNAAEMPPSLAAPQKLVLNQPPPLTAPPPPLAPPPPPLSAPPPETAPPPPPSSSSSEYPGQFEDLHKKCKEVFPVNFEGAKLVIQKGLSNHFQINHHMTMSSVSPSGYKFGATYVGTKQFSQTEAFPVLVGDIDPSGNMSAQILHAWRQDLRSKMIAQVQNGKFAGTQFSTEYRGSSKSAQVTLVNPDIVNDSGILISHYLQRVHSKVNLGAELVYQFGPQIPGKQIAVYSLGGSLLGHNWTGSLSASLMGAIHACYHHAIGPELQVGVEMDTNYAQQESTTNVGFQYDMPKADLTFRGMFDSNYNVGAVLEKKLQPLPFTFMLSAFLAHSKPTYRFGFGLMVG